jgi:hypothetical protein
LNLFQDLDTLQMQDHQRLILDPILELYSNYVKNEPIKINLSTYLMLYRIDRHATKNINRFRELLLGNTKKKECILLKLLNHPRQLTLKMYDI